MRRCSAALAFVFALALALQANAGKVFHDDFEDGSATDGNPVTWAPLNITSSDGGGTREVVDGSFVHTPRGLDTFLDEVNTEVVGEIYQDVSIRTRVLAGQGNQVALFARNTFVNGTDRKEFQVFGDILSNGALRLGYAQVDANGELFGDILQFIQTGWTPSAQDINLRMDVIGDTLSLTGWLEGEEQPSQPQVSANIGTLTDGNSNRVERGTVGLSVIPTDLNLPAPEPVAFRYVEVVPEPAADFDEDGDVDGADFLAWQRHLGGAGNLSQGDANSDGIVTAADLIIWKQHFGSGPAVVPANAAVPEPATLMLIVLTAAGVSTRRRRAWRISNTH